MSRRPYSIVGGQPNFEIRYWDINKRKISFSAMNHLVLDLSSGGLE